MPEPTHSRNRRWPRGAGLVLAALLVLTAAACSDDDDDTAAETSAPAATTAAPATTAAAATTAAITTPAFEPAVTIADFAFDPATVSVSAGQPLVFTNNDSTTHSVASTTSDLLVSDPLNEGDDFTVTFDTPGTYDYFCGIHNSMTGTVEVTA